MIYTPAELGAVVSACRHRGVILVDTPGRSQHSSGKLTELKEYISIVENKLVYLAVSAVTKYSDMLDIVDLFGVVPIDGLLMTKLDETATFGPIVNLVQRAGRPLTYLTTGQNVPADIEVATSERIAWLVVEDAYR